MELYVRHQEDHHCEKLEPAAREMRSTKALVENILSSADHGEKSAAVVKKPRSVKAQKTAAKVQLMKLKMKSNGDKSLPQTERVYFLVKTETMKSNMFIGKLAGNNTWRKTCAWCLG